MSDQETVPDRVLSITGLNVDYRIRSGHVAAVRDAALDIAPGEIVGLVGESGSGKSTLALAIAGLLPSNATVVADRFEVARRHLRLTSAASDRAAHRALLGSRIGVVFQDPASSLDPTMRVGRQIASPVKLHLGLTPGGVRQRVDWLIERTGLAGVPDIEKRYPHELSGGQKQRVMIAMSLAAGPALIIADEPTTALDVTVQAEILKLLAELRADLQISCLFVSHDLGVVSQLSDRAVVMRHGVMVEQGPTASLLSSPEHPYTRELLACSPRLGRGRGPISVPVAQDPTAEPGEVAR